MFNDVDETLANLLKADVPIDSSEVEIVFDRPTREWSNRLTGPTLNLYLFDIRERVDFRDDSWRITQRTNGAVTKERPPRRVDLAYIITAWAREPADEHRILGRVLSCLLRHLRVPAEHIHGDLANTPIPLLLRATEPDYLMKPVDFWGVMDNEMRTSLTWVITVPVDVFAPQTGPMVSSRELITAPMAGGSLDPVDARSLLVGGYVRIEGTDEPVVGASVRVAGHGHTAFTDSDGSFRIPGVSRGEHQVSIQTADGRSANRTMTVPSPNYDLTLGPDRDPAAEPEAGHPRCGRQRS